MFIEKNKVDGMIMLAWSFFGLLILLKIMPNIDYDFFWTAILVPFILMAHLKINQYNNKFYYELGETNGKLELRTLEYNSKSKKRIVKSGLTEMRQTCLDCDEQNHIKNTQCYKCGSKNMVW